jgi:hypothetical protein
MVGWRWDYVHPGNMLNYRIVRLTSLVASGSDPWSWLTRISKHPPGILNPCKHIVPLGVLKAP